jgi:trimeric autotransporter adhesin
VGATTSSQRNTYVFNANNPNDNSGTLNYFPKINVDYTLTNQQSDSTHSDLYTTTQSDSK